MSDQWTGGSQPWGGLNSGSNQPPPQAAGVTDVVTQLQGIVRQLTAVNQTLIATNAILSARAVGGIITASAGTTTVVAQPAVQSQSTITLTPTNAAASTLVKNNGYFITKSVGVGFTITFGGAAAGTETFTYLVSTPT